MIAYIGALFLVLGFLAVLKFSGLVGMSKRVIDISKRALADLRNSELDDDAKEVAMQTHAKGLFVLFIYIGVSAMAAVFLPVAVIWLLDRLQLVSLDAVLSAALSWPFIAVSSAAICIVLFFNRAR